MNTAANQELDEDKELREELSKLVEKIKGDDDELISSALKKIKYIICTSTATMTSVPKPLKYLAPYYSDIKAAYERFKNDSYKKECADVISFLALGPNTGDESYSREEHDCLHFYLKGTKMNIKDWGHEYVRQLEVEIVEEWPCLLNIYFNDMISLIKDIIQFDCKYHAEIQACDMLMEIDQLDMLEGYVDKSTYSRICLYLSSCIKFLTISEAENINLFIIRQYLRFDESIKAFILAMQMNDRKLANSIFYFCKDEILVKQMAFIAANQLYSINSRSDYDDVSNILDNAFLSNYFMLLARELDVLEPKSPEEVYKTWLEPATPLRSLLLVEKMDSARQNLASSFVNGFVNAGFGSDKLLTTENGNRWIYRNKDYGMISATASLGVLYLWDVDGGLTPIDKYLYSNEDYVKTGALIALGIVNCRVKNDCDPALALLSDYVSNNNKDTLQMGAIFGLGLAYAGTNRKDVLECLLPVIMTVSKMENLAVAGLACGLIAVGSGNKEVTQTISGRLLNLAHSESLKSSYMRLVVLGLGLCYIGHKNASEPCVKYLAPLPEPFKTISKCIINMCSYAGTGDVLIIQELLDIVSKEIEKSQDPSKSAHSNENVKSKEKKKIVKQEWDPNLAQAIATLAVAAVAIGEDTGTEMCQRILGNMGRYGDLGVRQAVPLAIGLISVSRPQLVLIDVLTKYAHDSNEEVSGNAIFCLGIIGAGTNNARLSAVLRQLAVFHVRNPPQLFMVRLAQGLVHLGKGTLTLNPFHTDRQLLDPCSMAGLLIPLMCLLDSHNIIMGYSHYLLYSLVVSMRPRWLLTLDENLQPLSVTVRVGQAVDTVGKAGIPKTIAGIRTHSTPILLASGERAELATEKYEQLTPTLDGICILKKKF